MGAVSTRGWRAVLALACVVQPLWSLPAGAADRIEPASTVVRRLNDTGADQCLDPDGVSIPCAGTGQDGESGRDVTHAKNSDGRVGFSFAKVCNSGEVAGTGACPAKPVLGPGANDWGCTRDKVTSLIWEVKTADGGPRDVNRVYTNFGDGSPGDVSAALAAVNATGMCGASDWRMPSYVELQGILDLGGRSSGLTIDARWFPNTAPLEYWTGTFPSADNPWYVHFATGYVHPGWTFFEFPVRFVRAGVAPPAVRFRTHGAEVRDNTTGLVWRRCAEGATFSAGHCTGSAQSFNWQNALSRAQSVQLETGVAWRLPNIKEIASVQNFPGGMDPVVFPDAPGLYWSSTVAGPSFTFFFFSGGSDWEFVLQPFPVRLVRDAP